MFHKYKRNFVRNVAIVASGAAGSQAITMAFAPLITRLYGPEAFGLLGTFMALVAVATPISALSYPIAIVLPKQDCEARGIVRLSMYIALCIAALAALLIMIAGDQLVNLLQVQQIGSLVWLIPFVIIIGAWLQTNRQWLIRKKYFNITARVAVIHAIVINIAKTAMGLFKPLATMLIVLYTFGSALHAFMLSRGVRKADADILKEEKSAASPSLWKLARTYYDFPLYRTPQEFVHGVSQSLPVLLLASFFGPYAAGFYALCMKILTLPAILIGKAVGDVFYPRINEAVHNRENLPKLILKATLALAAVGFLPFAIVVAFGPLLIGFVFGAEWTSSGEYARWLALLMFFQFINKPSVVTIPAFNLQLFLLFYEVIAAFLRFLALTVGFFVFENDLIAVALFSLVGLLMYIFLICYVILKSTEILNKDISRH